MINENQKRMVYILMGVSGAGKTFIGQKLADQMRLPFFDGDEFHPSENVKKMESGHPLNDDDRKPWLEILATNIAEWNQKDGGILACSALKESYRAILRGKSPDDVCFIYLKGSRQLIAERISNRSGHFMPEELLESQFKALEEPHKGITVSVDQPPEDIIEEILNKLRRFVL